MPLSMLFIILIIDFGFVSFLLVHCHFNFYSYMFCLLNQQCVEWMSILNKMNSIQQWTQHKIDWRKRKKLNSFSSSRGKVRYCTYVFFFFFFFRSCFHSLVNMLITIQLFLLCEYCLCGKRFSFNFFHFSSHTHSHFQFLYPYLVHTHSNFRFWGWYCYTVTYFTNDILFGSSGFFSSISGGLTKLICIILFPHFVSLCLLFLFFFRYEKFIVCD